MLVIPQSLQVLLLRLDDRAPLQQLFEFTSFTQQKKHALKVCAHIDNVPQNVVLELYKIVKNYRRSHGPSADNNKNHVAEAKLFVDENGTRISFNQNAIIDLFTNRAGRSQEKSPNCNHVW